MVAFSCTLGRVFSWDSEVAAREIAESAACLVGREKVHEVKVSRRANRFVPMLVMTRAVEQRIGALEAEVLVEPGTLAPTGLLFTFRSGLGPECSPLIQTWEEDFNGRRIGPAHIVFVGQQTLRSR